MAAKPPAGLSLVLGIASMIVIVAATNEYYKQTNTPNPVGDYLEKKTSGEPIPQYEYFKVTRVVDGDTLEVDIHGTKEKVRLIGINTPEAVDPRSPVQCFGKEASSRMKDLAQGNLVRLEYDDSQTFRDTYDRLLDYVYLEDGQMLNRKMLAEGYAYEYTYGTPYKYQQEFRELVALARTSGRGLWSTNTCDGKK